LGMAEAFGADDVISKPFEAEELLSRLARFDSGLLVLPRLTASSA
jgi:DNA-binding response OmpR family regulator